jgi:hypothetical protein
MAAGGFKTFVAGEILTAADTNDFLMQGVLVFASASARNSAITSPVEGQFAYLSDTNILTFYNGTAWEEFSTDPKDAVVSATTGSPTITTPSGFTTYRFTGAGSITISEPGVADLFLVGGGGSGGRQRSSANRNCGGGGAGGVMNLGAFYLAAGTYTVTIGAGGASNLFGGDSRIGDRVVAVGGARGGSTDFGPQNKGGSGGGGVCDTDANVHTGGQGTLVQGNAGGRGAQFDSNNFGGGGGGGATQVGAIGLTSPNAGGNGGNGLATSLTGSSVTYAGGGGGACLGGTAGAGGTGGGGKGQDSTAAVNGGANTGGGGGGAQSTNTPGLGGSGAVIIRVGV